MPKPGKLYRVCGLMQDLFIGPFNQLNIATTENIVHTPRGSIVLLLKYYKRPAGEMYHGFTFLFKDKLTSDGYYTLEGFENSFEEVV